MVPWYKLVSLRDKGIHFVTGGAQQVDKRRDNQLPFLICDSKLDKPVNDLTLKLFRTRVRLPPGPPSQGEKMEFLSSKSFSLICAILNGIFALSAFSNSSWGFGLRCLAFCCYCTNNYLKAGK